MPLQMNHLEIQTLLTFIMIPIKVVQSILMVTTEMLITTINGDNRDVNNNSIEDIDNRNESSNGDR